MSWVAPGEGNYVMETNYRYVGSGGDLSVRRPIIVLWSQIALIVAALAAVLVVAFLVTRLGTASTSRVQAAGLVPEFVPEPPAPERLPSTTQPPTTEEPEPAVGECTFWGDPHVRTFDGGRPSFYGAGEFWIVRSQTVSIQGRYLGTKYTKGLAATNKIAIGGPFLKGHTIEVGTLEDGPITVDGVPTLTEFPSLHRIGDLATIEYNAEGTLVDKATDVWEKHIVHMDLPLGVRLTVLRWRNYLDLRLVMKRQPGQDGSCGNFNRDPSDDTTEAIFTRIGARVASGELIFGHRTEASLSPEEKKLLAICRAELYERAKHDCPADLANIGSHAGRSERMSCMLDVCFGSNEHTLRMAKTLGI